MAAGVLGECALKRRRLPWTSPRAASSNARQRARIASQSHGPFVPGGEDVLRLIELEDPCGDRLAQAGSGFVSDGGLHKRYGRIGGRGDDARKAECRWSQTVERPLLSAFDPLAAAVGRGRLLQDVYDRPDSAALAS